MLGSCTTMSKLPFGMLYIPPGEFVMGSDHQDEEGVSDEFGLPVALYEDEWPKHRVFLEGYFIDELETTNGQYKEFLIATGHRAPPNWADINSKDGFLDHPVVYVNWFETNDYCKWAGKRLPTEAEWEKAARGMDGLNYPWGNEFDTEKANLFLASGNKNSTMPVGSFIDGQSPYGVLDMVGNVWEWTAGWYLPYNGNTTSQPDYGRKYRVTRGQSYQQIGHFSREDGLRLMKILARTPARFYDFPTAKMPDLGFRCVKSVHMAG